MRSASAGFLPPALVTYGWCRSAYTVVRSLAARGVTVHAADSSPLAMSRFSCHVSSFTQLPDFYAEPEAYVEALAGAMERTGAEVLLPCFEDVEVVIRHRARLPGKVRLAVPALADWELAEDKFDYIKRVGAAGCPVPETFKPRRLDELTEAGERLGFPVVVKVRMGNGARGVEIVEHEHDLHSVFTQLVKTFALPVHRWPIVQQRLAGRKFKLDGVFCNGGPAGTSVFEILRCKGAGKFGTSTFRRTVDAPDVTQHAIAALKALNWHGMFNTDWICDEDGKPHLIDINGRLSGAVAICYEAGMDLPWLWYQVAAGLEPDTDMTSKSGVCARWVLGDCIALVEHLAGGQYRGALDALKPVRGCRHDDFQWRDPLPFLGQVADYFSRFVASRGSVRPITEGMVR